MPSKSRAISRPTHRTVQGRVVYARKKHLLDARDALRILRHMPTPDSLQEFIALRDISMEIMFKALNGIVAIVGRWNAFGVVGAWVVNLLYTLWGWLNSSTDLPRGSRPPKF